MCEGVLWLQRHTATPIESRFITSGRLAQLGEHRVRNAGVGGSNPLPSTSLRSRQQAKQSRRSPEDEGGPSGRELRLGEPTLRLQGIVVARNLVTYVYILRSIPHPHHSYVGATNDLSARLEKHNVGAVTHTSKYAPWAIKTYIAFADEKRAFEFEKYLKSPSGRAFAKKRL
jgi:putative endonuclease